MLTCVQSWVDYLEIVVRTDSKLHNKKLQLVIHYITYFR